MNDSAAVPLSRAHSAARSARSVLPNLLLVIVGTVAALLLAEALVWVAIVVLHRPPLVVSDPDTGWATQARLSNADVAVSGGRFRVSTDQFGQRITGESAGSVPFSSRAILLVGDSFVFGLNVDDSDTFAWRLAQSMRDHRIVNLGVPGWGTDQELTSLERFLRSHRAQTISDIVVIVFENDFRDVQRALDPYLGRRKPVFHLDGTVLVGGDFTLSLVDRLMDYSRLVWLVRSKAAGLRKPRAIESDAGAAVVLACLRRMRRLGEASGARVHIVAHRLPDRISTVSDSIWRDVLARSEAVDITEAIRSAPGPSAIGFDGVHWSSAGHRRVAFLIQEVLKGSGPSGSGGQAHQPIAHAGDIECLFRTDGSLAGAGGCEMHAPDQLHKPGVRRLARQRAVRHVM